MVADEVRSLAQRCAVAAKETAQKIEHALAKSDEGVVISSEVATAANEHNSQAEELHKLIDDLEALTGGQGVRASGRVGGCARARYPSGR